MSLEPSPEKHREAEPPSRARKLRLWVAKRVPRGLRGLVLGMPEWGVRLAAVMVGLFLISSTVAFLRGVSGGMEFVNLALTDPMAALKQLGPGGKSPSQEALDAQAAEIAKIKLALMQMQASQGAQLAEDATGRRDRAVQGLYDSGEAEREAAAKLASGDVQGAADLLENAAQAATRGAAEKWRRIGALFTGADNARAERAYLAAYALDPSDYTTALELSRLKRVALRPQEAVKFATEAVSLAGTPRDRFAAMTALGMAQTAAGALDAAWSTHTAALADAEALAQRNGHDSGDVRNLAIAHFRLGLMKFDQGRDDKGESDFLKSYGLTADLAKAQMGNVGAAVDMTYPAMKLGELALGKGDLKQALTWFDRSLQIYKKAAQAQPDRIEAQRDMAIAFQKLGDTLLRAEAGELALNDYRSALSIMERLLAKTPGDKRAQRDLAVARNKAGDALAKMKNYREARAMYELALPVFLALSQEPGAAPILRRDLSVSYEKIGDAAIAEDRLAEALVWYEKSMPVAGALARDFPANPQFASDARATAQRTAELRRRLGR